MIAATLKQRITFCYVLFTALIILATLRTIASPSFISNEEKDNAKNNMTIMGTRGSNKTKTNGQGCISCGPCSYPELTEDRVLPSA